MYPKVHSLTGSLQPYRNNLPSLSLYSSNPDNQVLDAAFPIKEELGPRQE